MKSSRQGWTIRMMTFVGIQRIRLIRLNSLSNILCDVLIERHAEIPFFLQLVHLKEYASDQSRILVAELS